MKNIINNKKLLMKAFSFFILGVITSVEAITIDWTTNNASVVRDGSSFSLSIDGISATAEAFVVEWNGTNYTIFGPFPTNTSFSTANADGFLRVSEGLMLEEGLIGGITLSGKETCPGGGCGFDNGFYNLPTEARSIEKFNFVLITFDQAVDLETVINSRQSNFDHDFWLASGSSAPDLSLDFVSAFGGFATSIHNPSPSFQGAMDLSAIHNNLRYLVIGAPLNTEKALGIGNPDAARDSFAITSLTVQPAIPPISCATGTVSPNLNIHTPSLHYQSLGGIIELWADFEYYGQGDNNEFLWRLKEFGVKQ